MATGIAHRALVGAVVVASAVGLLSIIGRSFGGPQAKPVQQDDITPHHKAPPDNLADTDQGPMRLFAGEWSVRWRWMHPLARCAADQ